MEACISTCLFSEGQIIIHGYKYQHDIKKKLHRENCFGVLYLRQNIVVKMEHKVKICRAQKQNEIKNGYMLH